MAKLSQYLLLLKADLATSVGLLLALCAVYLFLRTLYRLFFHPLRHIPGPKLAAASHIVEFYYDVVKGGKFVFEMERWHQKYGPIVRINPRQVHISDPDYYDEIYAPSSKKRDKDPIFTAQFGAPESIIATVKHEHHRMRRSVMNSFFSKRSVMQLEPIIQEKIDILAERFKESKDSGVVLKLEYAYAALTADVISHYCYGTSEGYLDHHWPQNDIKDGLSGMGHFTHYFYFFPILASLTQKLPTRWLGKLDPAAKSFVDLQRRFIQASERAIRRGPKRDERPSLFDALIDPSLPESERSVGRLSQEAMIVLGAGTETTANTLSIGSYHLIKNRPILLKLREEVKQVLPNLSSRATWVQLEQLPYLTAVINESLRMAIGSTMRSARVANEPMTYKDYVIPAGTPLMTEHHFVFYSPDIFPQPEKFDPERWIKAAEEGNRLTKYQIAFSRGSRQCIGINMAYSELYLAFAMFARRFDFEIAGTTDEDLRYLRDYEVPCGQNGPWTVKARVKEVLTE